MFQTKLVYPTGIATFILSTAFRRVSKRPYINFGKLVCGRVGVSASQLQASCEHNGPLCRQRHLSGYRSRTRTI